MRFYCRGFTYTTQFCVECLDGATLDCGKPKKGLSSKMRADHATIEKATIADNATIAAALLGLFPGCVFVMLDFLNDRLPDKAIYRAAAEQCKVLFQKIVLFHRQNKRKPFEMVFFILFIIGFFIEWHTFTFFPGIVCPIKL